MTGREVLAQVREALLHRDGVIAAGWDKSDPMLDALDGCVLLTREETDDVAEMLTAWAGSENLDYLDAALALLTEEKP